MSNHQQLERSSLTHLVVEKFCTKNNLNSTKSHLFQIVYIQYEIIGKKLIVNNS